MFLNIGVRFIRKAEKKLFSKTHISTVGKNTTVLFELEQEYKTFKS